MGQLCSVESRAKQSSKSPQDQEENIYDDMDIVKKSEQPNNRPNSDSQLTRSSTQQQSNLSFDEIVDIYNKENLSKGITDQNFQKLKILGMGGFGKVFLVQYDKTQKYYAMKSIIKENIDEGLEKYMAQEKFILQCLKNHPFSIKLNYAFQNVQELFMVLEFCQGGELFNFLDKNKLYGEKTSQFYIAQLVLVLEYLHSKKVIYRDLKPQNILLHSDGYLRLTDFGLSKLLSGSQNTETVCGSRDYIAPEILQHMEYSYTADYFNLGIIAYELLTGKYLYYQFPDQQRIRKICLQQRSLIFPTDCSEDIKDFIYQLISPYPEERLGHNGIQDIKNHPFLKNVNWNDLYKQKIEPPQKPEFTGPTDLQYFDQRYVQQDIENMNDKSNAVMDIYRRYSYNQDDLQARPLSFSDKSQFFPRGKEDNELLQSVEDFATNVINHQSMHNSDVQQGV